MDMSDQVVFPVRSSTQQSSCQVPKIVAPFHVPELNSRLVVAQEDVFWSSMHTMSKRSVKVVELGSNHATQMICITDMDKVLLLTLTCEFRSQPAAVKFMVSIAKRFVRGDLKACDLQWYLDSRLKKKKKARRHLQWTVLFQLEKSCMPYRNHDPRLNQLVAHQPL